MTYLFWTFLALFLLTTFFYAFFYIKGLKYPEAVFKLLLIPFSAALLITILFVRIPDSFHVIQISLISFVFAEGFFAFQMLFKKFNVRLLEVISFASALLAIEVWNNIFFSVIYLVKIPDWFKTLIIIDLAAGFIAFCLITRPRILKIYGFYLAAFVIAGFIFYSALAELIFGKNIFGIPLFIGSLALLMDVLFFSARPKWARKKHSEFVMNLTFVAAEILISTATLLMIF